MIGWQQMARSGILKKAALQDKEYIARQDMDVPEVVFGDIAMGMLRSVGLVKGNLYATIWVI